MRKKVTEQKNEKVISINSQGIAPELVYARKYINSLSVVSKDSSKHLVTYLGESVTARLLRDTKTIVNALLEDLEYNWDKKLLNTPKGVFNVETGELENRNGRYFRQITNSYDENATAPYFCQFLDDLNSEDNPTFANDFLSMLAYAIFSPNNQKFFVILHGQGNDGKTTLQSAISHSLGSYATKIQVSALTYIKDRRFNPAIGSMDRARYFYASELNEGIMLDHSLLKEITSREDAVVPYETKGSNIVSEAHINGVLSLDSNYMPLLSEADPAILKRIATFEFSNSIPKEKIDHDLIKKLEEESSGILNLIIASYDPNWKMPQKYFDKTIDLLDKQTLDKDDLIDYILDETIIYTQNNEDRVRKAELHSLYRFKNNGIKPKEIKNALVKKGVAEVKIMGVRYYSGVKLKF